MRKLFYILCACICALSGLIMCYGGYLNYVSEKNIFQQLNIREIMLEGVRAKYVHLSTVHNIKHLFLEPYGHVDVIARQAGTISQILVKEHEFVKKDQVLAIIESKELDAQVAEVDAALSKAQTALNRAKISFERYSELVKVGAVSAERYDDAKANYDGSLSEVRSLKAQREATMVRSGQLVLRAPTDGSISKIYYSLNAYVNASTPVMLLEDNRKMVYYESISEEDLRKLYPLPEKWTLYLDDADHHADFASDYTKRLDIFSKGFNVTIGRIFPDLSERCKMRNITWCIDNDSNVLYNIHYRNARFVAGTKREALVIPVAALHGTKDEVYVFGKNNCPGKRIIKTGSSSGGMVQVLSGLGINEAVILTDPIVYANVKNRNFAFKEITSDAKKR